MEEQELQDNEQQLVDEQDNEQEIEEPLFLDEPEDEENSDNLSEEINKEEETDDEFDELDKEEESDDDEVEEEEYDEEDIINENEQEIEQSEQSEPNELEKPKQTPAPTNSGFFMKPEFTPGTEEFFKAAYADAKTKTEQSLGEEFDQYNPEHVARLNYFNNVAQQERIEEYHKGLEYIKRQEDEARHSAEVERKTQEVTAYLNAKLTTKEEQQAFAEVLEDKISRKHYRQLEEQVANGDYSGVDKLINKVKQLNGVMKQTRESNVLHSKSVNKGKNRTHLASDLFI